MVSDLMLLLQLHLHRMIIFGVPYTIVSNHSISESDNQTVMVSLVDTLDQNPLIGYPNNVVVRLTFDFSSSDTLDWMLLSEVRMFKLVSIA